MQTTKTNLSTLNKNLDIVLFSQKAPLLVSSPL